MKKFLSVFLSAAMAATMFAACGGGTSSSAASGSTASAAGSGSAASGGSLSIWVEKSFSEDVDQLINERIEAFAQESGVQVSAEFIAATDYMTKLNAAVEAGNVPDITLANPYKVVSYYPNIPYSDVTDLVDELDAERPMFEALKEGTKIEGVNYFVPFYAADSLLFVRTDLFEAAGVDLPTTWEELWDAAVAVSDPDNGVYGLGIGCGPTDEDCENSFRMMMWCNGGKLMDEEGNIVAAEDEGLRAMVEKYVELYEAGAIPPSSTTWDSGGNNKSYLMGESAMVINTSTLYNSIKDDPNYAELFENTAVINVPAGSDGSVLFGNPSGWSIMKDAKNPDAARDFIRFVSEKEWYDTYLEAIGPVFAPVYQDLAEDDVWTSGANLQAIEYVQNATGYYGYPAQTLEGRAIASKNYYSFPIARMLNSVVTGSQSIDDAIAQLDKELQDTADSVK